MHQKQAALLWQGDTGTDGGEVWEWEGGVTPFYRLRMHKGVGRENRSST